MYILQSYTSYTSHTSHTSHTSCKTYVYVYTYMTLPVTAVNSIPIW